MIKTSKPWSAAEKGIVQQGVDRGMPLHEIAPLIVGRSKMAVRVFVWKARRKSMAQSGVKDYPALPRAGRLAVGGTHKVFEPYEERQRTAIPDYVPVSNFAFPDQTEARRRAMAGR